MIWVQWWPSKQPIWWLSTRDPAAPASGVGDVRRLSRSCSGWQERGFYVELVESRAVYRPHYPYTSIGGPEGGPGGAQGARVRVPDLGPHRSAAGAPVGRGGGSLKPRFQISTPVRPVASAEVWPLLDRLYRVDTNLKLRQRSKGWRSGGGGSATRSHHSSPPPGRVMHKSM